MTDTSIYKDIAARTGGDIYIGIVGPVRTGKSTFIKRFFETMIIPDMPADFARERMIDELPQSSAGRTIMTTEPKFVPEKAVKLQLDKSSDISVRLVDCVGYIVPSSLGYIENENPRMVKTPWYDDEIPFNMAAEIGTKKVIREHATIGLVITTDGSISEIPRDEYEEAEERVINELKEINKPFTVVLNCVYPQSTASIALAAELTEKYGVPVIPLNCLNITDEEISSLLATVLCEFPVKKVIISLPGWFSDMSTDEEVKHGLIDSLRKEGAEIKKMREIGKLSDAVEKCTAVTYVSTQSIDRGSGTVYLKADMDSTIFYEMLSAVSGENITDDSELITSMRRLVEIKKKYDRIAAALEQVNSTGYGIVMPSVDELTLEEPEIVKQGSRYGVKLKASAPSIHMMRADIKTEVAPIVGSERQSEDLVKYLLDGFEEDPSKIWQSNIFGKSLDELVNEGLRAKLTHMPDEARMKLQQTLERVINEGCSGLICIIF
ncbi:MAG: stage IV sporulation protein A [Oscillospiraceae bacterium]|nr:stage IV sporulation protein A [Oscillospiraceae bacterium]